VQLRLLLPVYETGVVKRFVRVYVHKCNDLIRALFLSMPSKERERSAGRLEILNHLLCTSVELSKTYDYLLPMLWSKIPSNIYR
jgi:hypothetical protein